MDEEKLPEDIRRIQTKNYLNGVNEILSAAASVLCSVGEELCKKDYALYIPEQFRISERDGKKFPPVINRSVLFQVDRSGYLRQALEPLYPAAAANPTDKRLWDIPNDVFLPLVSRWVRQLPDQDQVMHRLLDHLDLSGAAKLLFYTSVDHTSVFVKMIVQECRPGPKTNVASLLNTFINLRNDYYGHSSKATPMDHTIATAAIESINKLVKVFENSPHEHIRAAAKHYADISERIRTMLSQPIIDLGLKEREYALPSGSFRKFFDKNSIYADRINDDRSKLLFVSTEELDTLIPAVRYNEELEAQIGARSTSGLEGRALQRKKLPALLQYHSNQRFSIEQLEELVSNFAILADASLLMSENGLRVLRELGRILLRKKQCLQVEWGTLLYIYQQEKESPDPKRQAMAKQARLQLYDMHHRQIIRYVDSGCYENDPGIGLLRLLQKHKDIPACVLTCDRRLIDMLCGITVPNCLCMSIWAGKEPGLFLRSESTQRFRDMLDGVKQSQPPEPIRRPQPVPVGEKSQKKPEPPAKIIPAQNVLPLEKVPVSGDTVLDEQGQPVRLGDMLGQPGGEGTVYQTDQTDLVAKIYHNDKRTQQRLDKLTVMRRIRLELPNVCWPKSILFDRQQNFVGFLMAAAAPDSIEMGLSVLKLAGPNVRTKLLPHWNRLQVVDCCITVSRTFAILHQRQILMGDVNPRNLLVSRSDAANVWFVDCDSYQVAKFTCPVGVAEYASPAMLARIEKSAGGYAGCPRTREDEQFSLATLLFQMVMLGQSPFAGKNSDRIGEAIRNYAFSFKTKENTGHDAPDGPYRLIWSNIPSTLREMFINTFTGKKTYSAKEWQARFEQYRGMILSGIHSDELLPRKYFDPKGEWFADFICDGCHQESNLPVETMEYIKKSNSPCFCNQCQAEMRRARTIPSTVNCSKCYRTVSCTLYDTIMAEDYGKPYICPECRNPRVQCAQCGKFFCTDMRTKEKIDSNDIKYPRCPDCMIAYKARKERNA